MSEKVTVAGILEGLLVYWRPGEIHEIRHFRGELVNHRCFDNAEAAATSIYSEACQEDQSDNFYLTLNPVDPAAEIKKAVCDMHILSRRSLVLDFDRAPELREVKDEKVSATDQELGAVLECAKAASIKLQKEFSWPEPILIMCGNGYHLVLEIDLPADDNSKTLISRVLKAANHLFSIPGVANIDEGVGNASRLVKIPGTIARKGTETPDRPHRMARIVSKPSEAPFVSLEQLQRVAALAPHRKILRTTPEAKFDGNHHSNSLQGKAWSREKLIEFLDRTGLGYKDPVPFEGGEKFVLNSMSIRSPSENNSRRILLPRRTSWIRL